MTAYNIDELKARQAELKEAKANLGEEMRLSESAHSEWREYSKLGEDIRTTLKIWESTGNLFDANDRAKFMARIETRLAEIQTVVDAFKAFEPSKATSEELAKVTAHNRALYSQEHKIDSELTKIRYDIETQTWRNKLGEFLKVTAYIGNGHQSWMLSAFDGEGATLIRWNGSKIVTREIADIQTLGTHTPESTWNPGDIWESPLAESLFAGDANYEDYKARKIARALEFAETKAVA